MDLKFVSKIDFNTIKEEIKKNLNDEIQIQTLWMMEYLGKYLFLKYASNNVINYLFVIELDQNFTPKFVEHKTFSFRFNACFWEQNGSTYYT